MFRAKTGNRNFLIGETIEDLPKRTSCAALLTPVLMKIICSF
jgi:hypothetical protein